MDENKGQVENTESHETPALKIAVNKVSSKAINDPLQVGFTFIINGFVYHVYETRSRGRKFIKFVGVQRGGN